MFLFSLCLMLATPAPKCHGICLSNQFLPRVITLFPPSTIFIDYDNQLECPYFPAILVSLAARPYVVVSSWGRGLIWGRAHFSDTSRPNMVTSRHTTTAMRVACGRKSAKRNRKLRLKTKFCSIEVNIAENKSRDFRNVINRNVSNSVKFPLKNATRFFVIR